MSPTNIVLYQVLLIFFLSFVSQIHKVLPLTTCFFIFMLRSLILTLNYYFCWQMCNSHCTISCIYVASCSPWSICPLLNLYHRLYVYIIFNRRVEPYTRLVCLLARYHGIFLLVYALLTRIPLSHMHILHLLLLKICQLYSLMFANYIVENFFIEPFHILRLNISAQSWLSVPPAQHGSLDKYSNHRFLQIKTTNFTFFYFLRISSILLMHSAITSSFFSAEANWNKSLIFLFL